MENWILPLDLMNLVITRKKRMSEKSSGSIVKMSWTSYSNSMISIAQSYVSTNLDEIAL